MARRSDSGPGALRRVLSSLRLAYRLYGTPATLGAALAKAHSLLRERGAAGLLRTVVGKLRTPQLPVALLTAEGAPGASLAYEERWVLVGRGLSQSHSVAMIILTKGNTPRIRDWLAAIQRSVLPESRLSVIVVNNGSALGPLPETPYPVQILRESRPFNWAAYNNRAARASHEEYLLFLNDDVQPLHGGWLDALLAEGIAPRTGAVGAKLLYPEGRIQHIGISLRAGPEGGHEYKFEPRDVQGRERECLRPRPVDAVTGACLLTSNACFASVDGFDEAFAESYNDVDYCLRLRCHGWDAVATPHAELLHLESATRPLRVLANERELFRGRWCNENAGSKPGSS